MKKRNAFQQKTKKKIMNGAVATALVMTPAVYGVLNSFPAVVAHADAGTTTTTTTTTTTGDTNPQINPLVEAVNTANNSDIMISALRNLFQVEEPQNMFLFMPYANQLNVANKLLLVSGTFITHNDVSNTMHGPVIDELNLTSVNKTTDTLDLYYNLQNLSINGYQKFDMTVYIDITGLNNLPESIRNIALSHLIAARPAEGYAISELEAAIDASILSATQPKELTVLSGKGNPGELVPVSIRLGMEQYGLLPSPNVAAIQFDLTFNQNLLDLVEEFLPVDHDGHNPELVQLNHQEYTNLTTNLTGNGSSYYPYNNVYYYVENDVYHFVIGHMDSINLGGDILTLPFGINPQAKYQEKGNIQLSNIIVTDMEGNTRELEDTAGFVQAIDTLAPVINLHQPSYKYAIKTSVYTDIKEQGNSGIKVKKWAKGDYTVENFPIGNVSTLGVNSEVSKDLTDSNQFTADSNGYYTVYVEDIAGNKSVARIFVNSIILKGDSSLDKYVDLFDWKKTARFIVNAEIPNSDQKYAADMNNDNTINVGDWRLLANKILVGNDIFPPVEPYPGSSTNNDVD